MEAADRLTRDERINVFRWAGEGYTSREICRLFNQGKGYGEPRIRIPGVEKILAMPEAQKYVAKFRMQFLKDVKDIPISEKRVRLDDAEKIRQRLVHLVNNCRMERGDKEILRFLTVSRRLVEILEFARNEMEQRPGLGIGIRIGEGELNDLSDDEIKQQRDELIRRAAKLIDSGASPVDNVAEGDEAADRAKSAPILLATSEELQRNELSDSSTDV